MLNKKHSLVLSYIVREESVYLLNSLKGVISDFLKYATYFDTFQEKAWKVSNKNTRFESCPDTYMDYLTSSNYNIDQLEPTTTVTCSNPWIIDDRSVYEFKIRLLSVHSSPGIGICNDYTLKCFLHCPVNTHPSILCCCLRHKVSENVKMIEFV